jgi:hypothetical protein
MARIAPALVALLVAAAPAIAQVYVPTAAASAGTINSIPLGARGPTGSFQNVRAQIRVPASYLPSAGSTITDLGFAGGGNGTYTFTSLEVRLAHLPGTFGATFAANVTNPVTVLSRTPATQVMRLDQWCMLGLTAPFVHDGQRDLIVDIVVQGSVFDGTQPGTRRSTTIEQVYATAYDARNPVTGGLGVTPNAANLALTVGGGTTVVVGAGCPKADQQPVGIGWRGTPTTATTFTLLATAAPANTPLALVFGTSETTFGALPLPLDLAPLGAPGCWLRTDVAHSFAATSDAAGAAQFGLAIPDNPTLRGLRLHFQWLAPAVGANALQLVVSAMVKGRVD